MRTVEEIGKHIRYEVLKSDQIHLFEERFIDLVCFLPFEQQKVYWGNHTEERYKELSSKLQLTRKCIIEQITGYMPFAWEKANNERGLSAIRSLEHMKTWTWFLNDEAMEVIPYEHYGKEKLIVICERLGFDWKE